MSLEFHRDYLIRLPQPLAQLYCRAYNAKDARGRHDHTFYLLEALIKLAATPLVAAYLDDAVRGGPRVAELDRRLAQLALPSLGQWLSILRDLAQYFGCRVDAATHPLGHLWQQLDSQRRDLPGVLALYRRIKNGPDGVPGGDQRCSLLELLDALVQYRNGVFGHGAGRFESFYEQEMGPLLFPAADEILADGVFDLLGPRGSRLVYLTELRMIDETHVELSLSDVVVPQSERLAPLSLTAEKAAGLAPNCLALQWPGRRVPLRLDPLLVFRTSDLGEEVLFLNRDRSGRQVEYLSYTTGRIERDRAMGPALTRLLSRIVGREVQRDELDRLAEASRAETPSVEALFTAAAAPQQVRGDYQILAELGRGGMGVVYLARQLSLGRIVALKMLPADLAGDEVALARFRREIRSLAQCDHPNIVKVLASGTLPDGQLYYTMEYVPGADLELVWRELAGGDQPAAASNLGGTTWSRAVLSASQKMRQKATTTPRPGTPETGVRSTNTDAGSRPPRPGTPGRGAGGEGPDPPTDDQPGKADFQQAPDLPLPPLPDLPAIDDAPGDYARRVALLMRDAARALQAVHDRQTVHRDVKPANLMLTPDGSRVVLMDFGLAKGQSLSLTASGAGGLLGTLRYAAPEQLAAATLKVGPQADVRGLGVTMWELLTRRRVFADAEDEKQLAAMIYDRDLPLLRAVDPTLDADLEAIVARATERSSADRIQTARQLAEYLDMYLAGQPLPIRPPSTTELLRRWVRQHAPLVTTAATALLVIIIIVAIAFVWITNSRNEALEAKGKAETLAVSEAEAKREVEQSNRQLKHKFGRSLMERGMEEVNTGHKDRGVALFADAYVKLCEAGDPLVDSALRLVGSWGQLLSIPVCHDVTVRVPGFPNYVMHNRVAVCFSPDSRTVLTGSADQTAQLWDVDTGKPWGQPLSHKSQVTAVSFNPDGRTILTGTRDGSVYLWDTITGRPRGEPLRHDRAVTAASFSPDGRMVVTGSEDGLACLWDAATGERLVKLLEHDLGVTVVSFSPDGRMVVTASKYMAYLWDAATGERLGKPLGHDMGLTVACVSPDGRTLLTGGGDCHAARLWDVATGQLRSEPLRHEGRVVAVCFSPNGRKVLTGSWDGTARLWDSETGQPRGILRHDSLVTDVSFSPDGQTVVTGSDDHTARVWDAATCRPRGEPLWHDCAVESVCFSPNGRTIITGSADRTARLWDLAGLQPRGKSLRHNSNVTAVCFSPDGRTILTGTADRTVRLWDITTRDPKGNPLRHEYALSFAAFSPDGHTVLTLTEDGAAHLWNSASGQRRGEPLRHSDKVVAICFSPDSRSVLAGSDDGTARLWDVGTGQPLTEPLRHDDKVTAVSFTPDGRTMLTASEDRTVRRWNASTGQPLGQSLSYDDSFRLVSLCPTGQTVVVGSEDDTLQLLDVATGRPRGKPLRHEGDVITAICFSSDGRTIVTGTLTGTARLWDASTGEPQSEPLKHKDTVCAVRFSQDARNVITASWDNTVSLWDAATGQSLGEPLLHEASVDAVTMSPDGRTLLTVGADSMVRLWDLPQPLFVDPHEVRLWVRLRTGWEVDDRSVLQRVSSTQWLQHWGSFAASNARLLEAMKAESERRRVQWHLSHAIQFESSLHWFAAAFHWSELLLLEPANSEFLRRRGVAYRRLERFADALTDLEKATECDPENIGAWIARGHVNAGLGCYRKAATDFARARELGSQDYLVWERLALSQLAGNDLSGYVQTCREMLALFAQARDSKTAHVIARVTTLSPKLWESETDHSALIGLAEFIHDGTPDHMELTHLQYIGAVLYRAGRFCDAEKSLKRVVTKMDYPNVLASTYFFLAMSCHQLGRHDDAKQWFDKAISRTENDWGHLEPGVQLIVINVIDVDSHVASPDWGGKVINRVLREEAEALLSGGEKPDDAPADRIDSGAALPAPGESP
jgi:eukaryotic-like serine/threonine-protein kinase